MKNKNQQNFSLNTLYEKLLLLQNIQQDKQQVLQAELNKQIEEGIKFLQYKFQDVLNSSWEAELKGDKSDCEAKQQHQQIVIKIVDCLIQQIIANENITTMEWLSSIVKIKCNYATNNKQQSIYELAKVATQNVAIALSYEPEPSQKQSRPVTSDSATQEQAINKKTYYTQDQSLLHKYFQSPFSIVARQGISIFATQLVQRLCHKFVRPFLQKQIATHSLETYIKFVDFVQSISAPMYTYYLLSLFRSIVEKLQQFLVKAQINSSVTIQKVNRLIYGLSSITDRWEGTDQYNRLWQWQIRSKIIVALVTSNVSQTKLTAVKVLCEFLRKIEYSVFEPNKIIKYIQDNKLLQSIFSPESHPQVIAKGKEVYQFLCKYMVLTQNQIGILLNLIDKSHQNVCKSLYLTIQSLGQKNLQIYHKTIFNKIQNLPRASLFTDETLQLMQTILVISSNMDIKNNMASIYKIIQKHYLKLRKHLREKIVRLYFQVFIMGVQEAAFVQDSKTAAIQPIAENLGTNLSALMIDTFIRTIKLQNGKAVQNQCKQILNQCIAVLFKVYKFHTKLNEYPNGNENGKNIVNKKNYKQILSNNPGFYSKQIHLAICKYMLDSYEGQSLPLNYSELCELVEQDISFSKFIQYYDDSQQIKAMQILLSQPNKDAEHISNIIQTYALLNSEVKKQAFQHIKQQFEITTNLSSKYKLGQFIVKQSKNLSIETICKNIGKHVNVNNMQQIKLFSLIILLKQIIEKDDKNGFGIYIPFIYTSNETQVLVMVTNSIDILNPTSYQFKVQSFETLSQVVQKILTHENLKISCVNLKINDKYMAINDLSLKVNEVAKVQPATENRGNQASKYVVVNIFEAYQNEWFDKTQLISEGHLNDNIMIALSQIFTKYATAGRMNRKDCARLFQLATQSEKMTTDDYRICHLFTHYSQNGQYLTLEEWLNFYHKSASDNPKIVVQNLKKLGYRHLFKQEEDLLHHYGNKSNQSRKYIAENASYIYDILLRNYQLKQLNNYCRLFLNMLPINTKFIQLKKIESNHNQNLQGDNQIVSQYKVQLYSQKIIQQMLELKNKNHKEIQYVLTLFMKIKKELIDEKKYCQIMQSIASMLKQEINKILVLTITQISNTYSLQIIFNMSLILKDYYQQRTKIKNLPTTLLSKKAQIGKQNQNQFGQPLTQVMLNTSIKQFSTLNHEEIQALALKLFDNYEMLKKIKQDIEVEKLINCLILICLYNPQIKKQGRVKINQSLIFNCYLEARTIFNNFYYLICQMCPQVKFQYYAINIDEYNSDSQKNTHRFTQFFNTLNKMLQIETNETDTAVYAKVSEDIQKSLKQLTNTKKQEINQMNTVSKTQIMYDNQDILRGKLMILDSIKLYQPNLQISNPQKWLSSLLVEAHSNQIHSILYRLSRMICSVQFNLDVLKKMMLGISINRNSKLKNQQHVGLFNLGCICYINSTIQQLFMIPSFRRGIIEANLSSDPTTYFYQFQYMIYQLAFGQRQFFVPDNFCLTYTDFQNKPIDIKQQHDADQFLNSLFDRLQKTLKSQTSLQIIGEDLIRHNFSGQLASITTCQSCFNMKVKYQDFYVLSLEIKNNKNISQCFEKLMEVEVITDYYCEQCEKKVQTLQKQIKIKKLPRFLFIHFQRLVFDLQSFSKIKLDHLVDYPQQLDLSQYLISDSQSLLQTDSEQAKYKLNGFIVHIGSSQSGHYYSIIKQNDKWLKFDDSRVEEWKWDNYSREKQNTYLLIYEKIVTNDQVDKKQSLLANQQQKIGSVQLYEKVKLDNQQAIRETVFLQPSFGKYLLQVLATIQIPNQLMNSSPNDLQIPYNPDHSILTLNLKEQYASAHDIIISYLKLASEAKAININFCEINSMQIKNATCFLVLLYHICPQLTERGIDQLIRSSETGKINNYYLRCMLIQSNKILRQAFKLIFTKIMSILDSQTAQIYHSYLIPALPNSHMYYIQKILQYLLGSLYDSAKHYSKMEQHFQFIFLTMRMSPKISYWFQQQGFGPKLIHFLCGDETPMKGKLDNYNYQNPKKSEAINVITEIICHMIHIYLYKATEQDNLSSIAYYETNWQNKIYEERYNYEHVGYTLACLCKQNQKLTFKICQLALQKLNRFSHSDQYILAYVNLYQHLLNIDDTLTLRRCEFLLGVPLFFVSSEELVANSGTRYFKYWSNNFTNSDQLILPILQLLYVNRFEINQFTLATVTSTLRLISSNSQILKYIKQLPAPFPCEFYTDWINSLLKNGIKTQYALKREILNKISQYLNIIQIKILQLNDGQNKQNQQKMQQINEQQQMLSTPLLQNNELIAVNKWNRFYRISGIMKVIKMILIKQEGQYELHAKLLEDDTGINLINYEFKISDEIKQASLEFKQPNYKYKFYISRAFVQLIVPAPSQMNAGNFSIESLKQLFNWKAIIKSEPVVMENTQIKKDGGIVNDEASQQKVEAPGISQSQAATIFQCPFCTSISYTFSRKCPTCGEDWGEMM